MILYVIAIIGHVPTYANCKENCCEPPRSHTTSQVIYLRGQGGLEIHFKKNKYNILNSTYLDVDAVFRDEIDQSTYDIYIGCGGCVQSQDSYIEKPLNLSGYEKAVIEPFTQTKYRSIFSKNDTRRKYNTEYLFEHCSNGHFTIRLLDYRNRSDGSEIVWAPVIGLAERFTFIELLEFPIYILKNHGYVWNELGHTFWIWIFVGAPLILVAFRFLSFSSVEILNFREKWRAICYELAIIGFIAAAGEQLTHLIYIQFNESIETQFWVALFIVIILPQGLGLAFVFVFARCTNSSYWAPFEFALGFSFLLLFGAGFYVGPVLIMLASLFRMTELLHLSSPPDVQISGIEIPEKKQSTKSSFKSSGLGFHS